MHLQICAIQTDVNFTHMFINAVSFTYRKNSPPFAFDLYFEKNVTSAHKTIVGQHSCSNK